LISDFNQMQAENRFNAHLANRGCVMKASRRSRQL